MGSLEIIRRQCAIYGTVIDGPYERGIDRGLRIAIAILEAELEGSPGAPEPASKEEQDLERSSVSRRETRLFYHVAAMKAHAESLILAAERPHGKYDDAKVETLIGTARGVAENLERMMVPLPWSAPFATNVKTEAASLRRAIASILNSSTFVPRETMEDPTNA